MWCDNYILSETASYVLFFVLDLYPNIYSRTTKNRYLGKIELFQISVFF